MKKSKYFLLPSIIAICGACSEDAHYNVVSRVCSVAKLATTEIVINKIVFGTSDKKLLHIIRLNQARFAAFSTATVTTGIDLYKLRPDDIKITGERIEILLPPVEVLNFSYPFSEFHIDETITENKFLNKIDINDQENFYRLAETDIRSNLPYIGISEVTEEKTRLFLTGILSAAGFKECYITFRSRELVKYYAESDSTTAVSKH